MVEATIERAAQSLQDCSRVLVFDEQGKVLYSSFAVGAPNTTWSWDPSPSSPASATVPAQVSSSELPALSRTLQDRESAIKGGMTVQATRFEARV